MEFLVEFESHIPSGTPEDEVQERYRAETDASARLAREGRLLRLWRPPVEHGQRKALGLYRAESREELDAIIGRLPLHDWMDITVRALEPHPSDPG